jgi:hypothetical protein
MLATDECSQTAIEKPRLVGNTSWNCLDSLPSCRCSKVVQVQQGCGPHSTPKPPYKLDAADGGKSFLCIPAAAVLGLRAAETGSATHLAFGSRGRNMCPADRTGPTSCQPASWACSAHSHPLSSPHKCCGPVNEQIELAEGEQYC